MNNKKRNYEKQFDLNSLVAERLEFLRNMSQEIELKLQDMPEGNLLVAPCQNSERYRYYARKNKSDKQGEYLNKDQKSFRDILANKKYYEKLIKSINSEILKLEKVEKLELVDSVIDTYTNLNYGIKSIIDPVNIDDKTYIEKWNQQAYIGLDFDDNDKTEYYSDKGERMRSKSEVLIANALAKHNVPYKYEMPVKRENGAYIYPDFCVLNIRKRKEIFWEHLGKMGDMEYVSRNLWKLNEYKKMGIVLGDNLICSFESFSNPIGTIDIERIISTIVEM